MPNRTLPIIHPTDRAERAEHRAGVLAHAARCADRFIAEGRADWAQLVLAAGLAA